MPASPLCRQGILLANRYELIEKFIQMKSENYICHAVCWPITCGDGFATMLISLVLRADSREKNKKNQAIGPEPRRRLKPFRLRHLWVQHGKGKEARLRAGEHPQGMALLALPCHATGEFWKWTGELELRRVRLPKRSVCAAVADGFAVPPREVTFPIRPHWFSVGLFAAAILRLICTGQDSCRICYIKASSAGRSVCHLTQRHGTLSIIRF
jgi:hypothetical protein